MRLTWMGTTAIGTVQETTRTKAINVIELYIDTCNDQSIDDSKTSSVVNFVQQMNKDGLKASSIRTMTSMLCAYFLFGYRLKLHEDCPCLQKMINTWEKMRQLFKLR